MRNYLANTPNPFNLAAPPASFLVDLARYDDKLVIFPSRTEAVYRFCRKASLRRFWMSFDKTHGDAETCIRHQLIPLKAILPSPAWGQTLLNAIAACDVQKVGGGVAAADLLDQQEELEERMQQASQDDECDARSSEAYRGLSAQMGSRIHLGTVKPSGAGGTKNPLTARTANPRRVHRPRGTSNHAIFVGR